ncbi:MAG TPA: branched-chain amino acid ABC transporter permease, partial [Ktedonobacteraceae bacterium]|nr:branched-chain amino acid ABC transporter permease [Ktedonobacteraceae bacterium]
LRDDEGRAQGLGVQVGASKLIVFMVSASFVGMAGAISAYFLGSISPPSAFDRSLNIAIPLMALLGGAGTLWGPIIGALLVVPLQQYLTLQYGAQGWDLILYGLLLLGVVRLLPEGIIPTFLRRWSTGVNFGHSINAMKSTSFTTQEVLTAVSGNTGSPSPGTQATPYTAVAHAQQPERIATSIPHHYAESPNHRRSTQKIRAQRLMPLTTMASTTSPEQVSTPPNYKNPLKRSGRNI